MKHCIVLITCLFAFQSIACTGVPEVKQYNAISTPCWDFHGAVNKAIADGWQPYGGVSVSMVTNRLKTRTFRGCSQAMVKYRMDNGDKPAAHPASIAPVRTPALVAP